jgi:TM2 domain-containing membrane protein YozV
MYYLRQQTRVSGPFTLEQLRTLLHKGRAARSDKISTDRLNWRAIGECQEIVEHVKPPATEATATLEPDPGAVAGDGYDWHYATGGVQQAATLGTAALRELIKAGRVVASDIVWRNGFGDWQAVSTVPELADALPAALVVDPHWPGPQPGPWPQPTGGGGLPAPGGRDERAAFVAKKLPAGLLALFLGPLGIHKFLLGLTTGGVVMLVLCFLVVPIPVLSIIALVEGITYLTKSDEKFFEDYALRKKQWF